MGYGSFINRTNNNRVDLGGCGSYQKHSEVGNGIEAGLFEIDQGPVFVTMTGWSYCQLAVSGIKLRRPSLPPLCRGSSLLVVSGTAVSEVDRCLYFVRDLVQLLYLVIITQTWIFVAVCRGSCGLEIR